MTTTNVVILGSTGSIGTSALDVVRHLNGRFRVVGLAAGSNVELLASQAHAFSPSEIVIGDSQQLLELRNNVPAGTQCAAGPEALTALATRSDVDIVLCAIVGTAGLRPVIEALKLGKTVALASKEILVMAGRLIRELLVRHGGRLIPVDSEHSAIMQCLAGQPANAVSRLILTASGGPFRAYTTSQFASITPSMTQAHPTWRMGRKITTDSATLMNKALEYIEAHYLFDMPCEQIEVVIHPQSVIHSMVEFVDRTIIAQMGVPDMRLPIQYALTWPERVASHLPPFDFTQHASLTFEPVNPAFPSIDFARDTVRAGGTLPLALNAANEVAVERFFRGEIGFGDIFRIVGHVLETHRGFPDDTLESLLEADAEVRRCAWEITA